MPRRGKHPNSQKKSKSKQQIPPAQLEKIQELIKYRLYLEALQAKQELQHTALVAPLICTAGVAATNKINLLTESNYAYYSLFLIAIWLTYNNVYPNKFYNNITNIIDTQTSDLAIYNNEKLDY